MSDAISIEATNKIRKSLGLPLLPVPGGGPVFKEASSDSESEEEAGSTLESRQAQAYDNYKRIEDDRKDKASRDARKEAIRKARDLAARNVKLEGKGLGEADDQEQDTRAWLIGQKKRQKKIDREREKTRRLEEELKERENQAYTSKDLAGVRVAHEIGDFGEENEHVLVLKDTTIDVNEDEGDELENVDLRDQERRDERLQLKKKRPVYNPNEEGNDGTGQVLQQYDEVIDGKKRKRFTLDTDGQSAEQKEAVGNTLGEQTKKQAISLDIFKDVAQSDYTEPKEVKVRKPKKQKTKSTRKKAANEEDDDIFPASATTAGHEMEVDDALNTTSSKLKVTSFIDDDDLQASLARQRREALKKRKKNQPEDLARLVRDEEANAMQEDEEADDGGLVIDETSFFVSNIDERQRELEEQQEAEERRQAESAVAVIKKEDGDDDENGGDVRMTEIDTSEGPHIKAEEDVAGSNEVSATTGLGDETSLGRGLGGTLGFLKGRNMWEGSDESRSNANTRQKEAFLDRKRRIEADYDAKAKAARMAGRASDRYTGMSQRDREEMLRRDNDMRHYQESQEIARAFEKDYVPSFELRHRDEHGRDLSQKEAFKSLSHQFHGKGSGKMKTEKSLKKIEMEKKNEAKSLTSNDDMSNYSNAADATAKRRGTVGVQLGK